LRDDAALKPRAVVARTLAFIMDSI